MLKIETWLSENWRDTAHALGMSGLAGIAAASLVALALVLR